MKGSVFVLGLFGWDAFKMRREEQIKIFCWLKANWTDVGTEWKRIGCF